MPALRRDVDVSRLSRADAERMNRAAMHNRWSRFAAFVTGWAFLGLVLTLELYFNLRAGGQMMHVDSGAQTMTVDFLIVWSWSFWLFVLVLPFLGYYSLLYHEAWQNYKACSQLDKVAQPLGGEAYISALREEREAILKMVREMPSV